jgi:hypothetical protein
MFVRRGPAIVLSLVLSAAALTLAPSATAGDGGTVKDVDPCEKASTVKLRVTMLEGGQLEATGIVWSNDEDVWDWRFKHNDSLSYEGDVKAKDADKSFKIVRTMVNFDGPDSIVFRAQNRATDEVCRAELYY